MPNSSGAPRESDDWRETTLSHVRKLIEQADPEMVEERKWRKKATPEGVPVWSHNGMICTGETYKTHVKFTFARGASLKAPSSLFNSSLEGDTRRAIAYICHHPSNWFFLLMTLFLWEPYGCNKNELIENVLNLGRLLENLSVKRAVKSYSFVSSHSDRDLLLIKRRLALILGQ